MAVSYWCRTLLRSTFSFALAMCILAAQPSWSAKPEPAPHGHPTNPPAATTTTTFALIGVVAAADAGITATSGTVEKHAANPLLGPGPRFTSDNGYLSVVHDPTDPLGAYRMWYDASPTQKGAICYANSTDGVRWEEPVLGLINVTGKGGKSGTANNCVVVANGLGVYRDPREPPGSRALFKAFGGIGVYNGRLANHGGTLTSPDGLHWGSPRIYAWPDPPQRYDTSNNVFYDDATRRYVATTRRHPTTARADGDRAIGIALSAVDDFTFNASGELPLIHQGTHEHQLYAQVTWKWHQLYVMITITTTRPCCPCALVPACTRPAPLAPRSPCRRKPSLVLTCSCTPVGWRGAITDAGTWAS